MNKQMTIINNLTDTDLYKLTMMQAVLHKHPEAVVKYRFTCRNGSGLPYEDMDENRAYVEKIKKEIDNLCSLMFTNEELVYLGGLSFIKPDFIDHLKNFKLNREHICVSLEKGDTLSIQIQGKWVSTIMFEVPVLAIVSQIYNESISALSKGMLAEGEEHLKEKIEFLSELQCNGELKDFTFVDMGTRRRFSYRWQESVLKELAGKCGQMFAGTSNVYFAMKSGYKCIGTMAHEWLQAHQQLCNRIEDSQKTALENWMNEYKYELGIALSDVVGIDAFLRDFDKYLSTSFSGARHDSGDPFTWCEKLINHYKSLKIDPRTKTAVFSDSLDFNMAVELYKTFHKRINTAFGIGTWLTNDMGIEAKQFVIKMVQCNSMPVAKISDSKGKTICEDKAYEELVRRIFKINRQNNKEVPC